FCPTLDSGWIPAYAGTTNGDDERGRLRDTRKKRPSFPRRREPILKLRSRDVSQSRRDAVTRRSESRRRILSFGFLRPASRRKSFCTDAGLRMDPRLRGDDEQRSTVRHSRG